MDALILNVETLPLSIRRKFSTQKVSVKEHSEGVLIMPLQEKRTELWGLLADGRLTSEKFLEQKRNDKELEE